MNYLVEKNKLYSLVDEEFWNLLAHHSAIVAGGAITSLFCNREINDIDIYFRSEEDLVKVLAAIFNIEDIYGYELDRFSIHVSGLSQRTIICSANEQMIQLMTFKYFPEIDDIFNTFDFTCCMGAFDCKSEEFVFHPEFMKHNSQRYLKFNDGTAFPLMSLMRVDKYRGKGYSISKAELLRVVFACMSLDINSWEEAKEHIGGMYGYDMSEAFDEDRQFSIGELGEQLSTLNERGTSLYTPVDQSADFWEISEKLFYKSELKEDNTPVFDDSKYLYKCVDADYKSYWSGGYNKIHYVQGETIDVPSGGLYFHGSSLNTFSTTGYWVECEVIGGQIEELSKDKKKVVGGQVKIVRTFEHSDSSNPVEKYMIDKYGVEEE